MSGRSIPKIIEQIISGQLRIPAFQRGFVWDAERVAYLMDSIYKGYPFGAAILWRTKEQLKSDRQLGPFPLSDRDPDYPVDYVLDGQQRLTSIFGVFQTQLDPSADASWARVYFDLAASPDLQESQFISLPDDKVEPGRHFPIGTFFDVSGYRQATKSLDDETADRIGKVQFAFQQASIPIQLVETDDRAKVAIVFERVNRMGIRLDVLQLLSAWTWSEDFDLQDKFAELAEDLRPFGFHEVGDDSNLLLRACAAIVAGDVAPGKLIGLNGGEVRDRFGEVVNGLKGAIEFLKANLRIETLENLPYAALLVPLAVFFATPGTTSVKMTDAQRQTLLRWFWRSCFSRRYSAGVIRNLNRDITEARNLRLGEKSTLDNIPVTIDPDFFVNQTFTVGTVHTNVFVLLLAQVNPVSFVSGNPVQLGEVLQAYNRNEFHHVYPRAYLKKLGRETGDINLLANFVFLSAVDNKTLGGVAPSVYRAKMDSDSVPRILEKALCPASIFDDDYDVFLRERAELLTAAAKKLVGQ